MFIFECVFFKEKCKIFSKIAAAFKTHLAFCLFWGCLRWCQGICANDICCTDIKCNDVKCFAKMLLWLILKMIVNCKILANQQNTENFQPQPHLWPCSKWDCDQKVPKCSVDGTALFKNVNNCLNINIYSYLETSGGKSCNLYLYVVCFFNTSVN